MQLSISHRPLKLSDVYGLVDVKREFYKRAKTNNWPQAILLRGPFGTGKTTIAQILAMQINCKSLSIDGDPCGVCSSCKSIIEERFDRDTIQFDGGQASKDDVIELIQTAVRSKPFYDKKRVIILEEADQLSVKAKNVLLKTLEKPNDNVVFILLSMERNGISPAIQSRCQKYDFKSHTIQDLMLYMKSILEKEGLWSEDRLPKEFKFQGLALIAQSCDGSMREAVQLLEKCITGEYFTEEQIRDNLGIVSEAATVDLLHKVLQKDEDVWNDLTTIDPIEFFMMSFKILTDAYVAKITGYVADERFKSNTMKLANHTNFDSLMNTFSILNTKSKPYLKKTEILYELASYWKSTSKLVEDILKVRIRGEK